MPVAAQVQPHKAKAKLPMPMTEAWSQVPPMTAHISTMFHTPWRRSSIIARRCPLCCSSVKRSPWACNTQRLVGSALVDNSSPTSCFFRATNTRVRLQAVGKAARIRHRLWGEFANNFELFSKTLSVGNQTKRWLSLLYDQPLLPSLLVSINFVGFLLQRFLANIFTLVAGIIQTHIMTMRLLSSARCSQSPPVAASTTLSPAQSTSTDC